MFSYLEKENEGMEMKPNSLLMPASDLIVR